MLAVDLTINLDLNYGQVDYATLERVIHEALAQAQIPVVDVLVDATRPIANPLGPGTGLPAPDFPLGPSGAPMTRPPGGRY